ncbi:MULTISPECIES: sulfur carrier protein ThiS [Acetobacter]|jgi:sulfur carrier protein|uniref:Sulfur carrier protein n=1 Tax=Acetobacter lovaniensis TaxID=104100 RepID=A0A841QBS0_9PROT|nr:sulfur carrier protein ThiS [Acetobacter lovaniensis]MBB6455632.1 sulfur carrier protein [Acetobacter lovaniensis]MCI1697434.1 sulfur carrier protein ThiS [Acetobacter lovaniensis]MCI1796322.1 sulfur carrier protein ThiS [Acetobacter lovaniensis]MCP1238533.1 sulfur carrier protein ThiS [Acetobacter lovaniensis]NHN80031.1 sulfur carrier protein ThiS [Acetobacter lovaniensis]
MKITVNDEAQDVSATTLAGLIDELGYAGARIATALNGQFVPKTERERAALVVGARVEIVAPMQGG